MPPLVQIYHVPDVEAEQLAPAAAVQHHGLRLAAKHQEVVEQVEEEVAHHHRQRDLDGGDLCKERKEPPQ